MGEECKGSLLTGTGCGHCERCEKERAQIAADVDKHSTLGEFEEFEATTVTYESKATHELMVTISNEAATKLSAACVVVIAFYPDGKGFSIKEGGASPMPFTTMHRELLRAWEALEDGKALGRDHMQ